MVGTRIPLKGEESDSISGLITNLGAESHGSTTRDRNKGGRKSKGVRSH